MTRAKNLGQPDESIELPGIVEHLVEIGDLTVGRTIQQPGWRWSTHVQPVVGGDWCQAHHIGYVLSGRFGVTFDDGTALELGPDDVYDIRSGHDGYTIGDEPCVLLEWSGLRTFAASNIGFHGRVLMTMLFTDVVDSTASATRLGDVAWRELLTRHYHLVRAQLETFKGREVNTTGDGVLAAFEAPAPALRCAAVIRRACERDGPAVRIGIHVGEVDVVGTDVRGIAVHEAARIMSSAGPNEIHVSDVVKLLAPADFSFEDRGVHSFKGLPDAMHLHAFVG